ncbi:GNAT family N-acetyltransferase [Fictibacillus sp. Mic-4]|uniref:GNAT family N-acetyltransferase n=1 Tax=Fictibacillus sp. Mic-4 TaxID=3132826 RepID=UPI003CED730E
MVVLRKMNDEEFSVYLSYSVKNYGEEKAKAGNWPKEKALELAQQEFDQLLPDGLHTKNHFLYQIVDETSNEKVGYLWFHERGEDQKTAFIYDFLIYEKHRGRGYAKQALAALEEVAKDRGIKTIRLHVFGHNQTAIKLYEKCGFEATNIQMAKMIF